MYTYGIVPDHDLADCVLCVNIDRVFKSVREVCRQINMRCVGCVLTFCSCMSWCPSVYKEGVEGLKKSEKSVCVGNNKSCWACTYGTCCRAPILP